MVGLGHESHELTQQNPIIFNRHVHTLGRYLISIKGSFQRRNDQEQPWRERVFSLHYTLLHVHCFLVLHRQVSLRLLTLPVFITSPSRHQKSRLESGLNGYPSSGSSTSLVHHMHMHEECLFGITVSDTRNVILTRTFTMCSLTDVRPTLDVLAILIGATSRNCVTIRSRSSAIL